ncbi:hypothetical protein [Marixanthomonas spongiae]|uniref:Uncharacterized protein n=1 Tax=Marixanthomonas spongiae TaxID=2174845 RepID=A0A2U0HY48_9FLAO|nr:hypothetical protein [Marixanthomonas spongiae]PVW13785.1 hypothetical protein DDV96_11545 [Marixanthomonas spongiae]
MLSPEPILLNLSFATLEIHENCVISTIKEGILFDKEERKQLYEVFKQHFRQKPFVYISNRKNDYTVNPTSYLQEDDFAQLMGMAVLCYSKSTYDNALFEKRFYKQEFHVFYSFQTCEHWAKEVLFSKN